MIRRATAEAVGMSDSILSRSQHGGVLTLTFNRPEKLNAFNVELTAALIEALEDAGQERAVRVVVLQGSGRGFSSGQDLEEFAALRASSSRFSIAEHLRTGFNRAVLKIRALDKPVIAALNGVAAGVGLSLALACDVRIASDDTLLTLGFSKIGLIPDGGGSLFLPLLAGFGRGLELAWTSDRIDAHEAHRLGIVNRVVTAPALHEEAAAYAQSFAEISPTALALTKRAFNRSMVPRLAAWLEEEALLQEEAASGPDLAEGIRAFAEKRKPAFVR
jgi:2-(1,2-epoxy-1,2-dihydrophenyl)acetyl-CoA isomerase